MLALSFAVRECMEHRSGRWWVAIAGQALPAIGMTSLAIVALLITLDLPVPPVAIPVAAVAALVGDVPWGRFWCLIRMGPKRLRGYVFLREAKEA
jgi:hypothetical protein